MFVGLIACKGCLSCLHLVRGCRVLTSGCCRTRRQLWLWRMKDSSSGLSLASAGCWPALPRVALCGCDTLSGCPLAAGLLPSVILRLDVKLLPRAETLLLTLRPGCSSSDLLGAGGLSPAGLLRAALSALSAASTAATTLPMMLRPHVLFAMLALYRSGQACCIRCAIWTALLGAPTPYRVSIASMLLLAAACLLCPPVAPLLLAALALCVSI